MNPSRVFQGAVDGLGVLITMRPDVGIFRMARNRLTRSTRFYVPGVEGLLDGQSVTPELANLMRLPFPCTSVLVDGFGSCPGGPDLHQRITIAFAVDEYPEIRDGVKWERDAPPRIGIFSVWSAKDHSVTHGLKWLCDPCIYFVSYPDNQPGFIVNVWSDDPYIGDAFRSGRDFDGDVATIHDLCVRLALKNIGHMIVRPSKQKPKRGKGDINAGLHYHILTIDGHPAYESGGGHGAGKRSHFRRGHIRRLGPGRFTWVRHCLVHGSKDGFIVKDYQVTP